MSLELLKIGELTPQQVLAACLNDKIEDVEAVIVVRIMKPDGLYVFSNSQCSTSQKALAATLLGNVVVQDALASK